MEKKVIRVREVKKMPVREVERVKEVVGNVEIVRIKEERVRRVVRQQGAGRNVREIDDDIKEVRLQGKGQYEDPPLGIDDDFKQIRLHGDGKDQEPIIFKAVGGPPPMEPVPKEPRCTKCNKRVRVYKETSEGAKLCSDCYCCDRCGITLESDQRYKSGKMRYCDSCYELKNADKCYVCFDPIRGDSGRREEGNKICEKCFTCAKCHKSLLHGSVHYRKNYRYCTMCC